MLLANEMMGVVIRVRDLTLVDLKGKTIFELLASATEELGEFSRELKIEEKTAGNTYKTPDEGTRAEAVDLAICALSLFYGRGGNHAELIAIMQNKLDKWEKHQPK